MTDKRNVAWQVVSVQDALQTFLRHLDLRLPEPEIIPLENALGRVLARDVLSESMLPAFSRSSVDGYAVNSKDTYGASDSQPMYLSIVGEVAMGELPSFSVGPGQAARIPTGGALPVGCDAVVMVEHTELVSENLVAVNKGVAPWENVLVEGEDIKAGSVVLGRGTRLRARDLGLLSAVGASRVPVFKVPSVAVVAVGDELVAPESIPAPGEIRDINSYIIMGSVLRDGGRPEFLGIVKDDVNQLVSVLSRALEFDLVILSGGSSVGARDVTVNAINHFGSPGVIVHGVAVKPGKPTLLAVIMGKPVVGLPGHPYSAAITYQLFAKPVLGKISGQTNVAQFEHRLMATLTRNLPSVIGREDYVRAKLDYKENDIFVHPILGKSGLISSFSLADGVIRVPSGVEGVEAGEKVEVLLLD